MIKTACAKIAFSTIGMCKNCIFNNWNMQKLHFQKRGFAGFNLGSSYCLRTDHPFVFGIILLFALEPRSIYYSYLTCGRSKVRVRLDALTECSLTAHPAAFYSFNFILFIINRTAKKHNYTLKNTLKLGKQKYYNAWTIY